MNDGIPLKKDTVKSSIGSEWFPLFTDIEELNKLPTTNVNINCPIRMILEDGLNSDRVDGVVINPFGESLTLNKDILKLLFNHMNEGDR